MTRTVKPDMLTRMKDRLGFKWS
jgi:hypothetical protein